MTHEATVLLRDASNGGYFINYLERERNKIVTYFFYLKSLVLKRFRAISVYGYCFKLYVHIASENNFADLCILKNVGGCNICTDYFDN